MRTILGRKGQKTLVQSFTAVGLYDYGFSNGEHSIDASDDDFCSNLEQFAYEGNFQSSASHITWKRKIEREDFEKLIKLLPPKHRAIFRMYFMEDMTMKEIGDFVGLTESAISQTIGKNKAFLAKKLKDLR